jgi:hypothetical protein
MDCALVGREEGFPWHALRVCDPALLALPAVRCKRNDRGGRPSGPTTADPRYPTVGPRRSFSILVGSLAARPRCSRRLASFSGLGSSGRPALCSAGRAASSAAVLGKVPDEFVHGREIDAVDQASTFPSLHDQSCSVKILEMESQRRRCESNSFADGTGGQAVRALLDK